MAKDIRHRLRELCSFTIKQMRSERLITLLRIGQETRGLNVFFATLCVIDLFGVFPIVALPSALISCGFYGIPLLGFVIFLQIYTAIVLGRCWVIAEKIDPSIVHKSRWELFRCSDSVVRQQQSACEECMLIQLCYIGSGIHTRPSPTWFTASECGI